MLYGITGANISVACGQIRFANLEISIHIVPFYFFKLDFASHRFRITHRSFGVLCIIVKQISWNRINAFFGF